MKMQLKPLTWDSVGDRHEWRVEGRGDSPHGVVPHDAGQAKGGDHLSEGGVRSCQAQTQKGGNAWHRDGTMQELNHNKWQLLL